MAHRLAALTLAVSLVGPGAHAQVPRLTRVAEIGCETCGGPTEFAVIHDVTMTDSVTVLVTGSETPMLRMFDLSGRVLWSTGKAGMGPGEFRQPMRAIVGGGAVQVLDLNQRRVTRFRPGGQYSSSALVTAFPAAVSVQGRTGAFIVMLDDFRGGRTLQRWTARDSGTTIGLLPAPADPPPPGITFPSIAVAGDGAMALVRDGNTYRIERLSADGKVVSTISRDIPRLKRTDEELERLERVRARAQARARVEAGRPRPPGPAPRVSGDPSLKPHVAIDGLRFDDAGRLWVRTMRGDETFTIFDVFSPAGAFLGEVRAEGAVGPFSLAGRYLATAGVTDEGYSVVRVYEVR